MDRTLTIPFTWDQKDQEGRAEQFGNAARVWIDNTEMVMVTVAFDAATGVGAASVDANLNPGVDYLVELALIDDDGTTGTRAGASFRYDDAGPTAPTLGTITSVPKP